MGLELTDDQAARREAIRSFVTTLADRPDYLAPDHPFCVSIRTEVGAALVRIEARDLADERNQSGRNCMLRYAAMR